VTTVRESQAVLAVSERAAAKKRQIMLAGRKVANKVLEPHFEIQARRLENLIQPDLPMAMKDFNHLLHELRTVQLRRLPAQD
jgi:hypothetical protein